MFTLELPPGLGASVDARRLSRRGSTSRQKKQEQCEQAHGNVSAKVLSDFSARTRTGE
jgi:hypothetical protein